MTIIPTMMNKKHKIQEQFEFAMKMDIEDFDWDFDLEWYTNQETQLCWLTWLTSMHFYEERNNGN